MSRGAGHADENGGVPEDDAGTLAEETLLVKPDRLPNRVETEVSPIFSAPRVPVVVLRKNAEGPLVMVPRSASLHSGVAPADGGPLTEIWSTPDYLGREVVFTLERRARVLQRHGDMADRLDEIRTTVEHPDFVTRDRGYPRREVHYRYTPSGQGFIRVVVNYRPVPPQGTWAGAIITAFRVEEREPKEVQLWP